MSAADACTIERHEADKLSPAALAHGYEAHAELWRFDDEALAMYTCRRCRSTICIPVPLIFGAPRVLLGPEVDVDAWFAALPVAS